jgi:Calcineurin-like phosphoesterase
VTRLAALLAAVALAAVGAATASEQPAAAQTTPAVRVVVVGDISPPPAEARTYDHATAAIALGWNPHRILLPGDLQYETGLLADYRSTTGYAASWGRPQLYDRSCPAFGNHEYYHPGPGAAGSFDYWRPRLAVCATAGHPGQAYYAFDLNGWRIYALSADCARSDGTGPTCGPGSAQLTWLQNDLAANPRRCSLAFFHQGRWGSGFFADDPVLQPIWAALHHAHVDLTLNGHEHHYARFGPLNDAGVLQSTGAGIRAIVIGTGGRSLLGQRNAGHPGIRYRDFAHYGVLRLTLTPTTWASEFARTDGVVADRTGQVGCWA